MLGVLLILTLPPCRAVFGQDSVWGEEGILSPASGSSSQWYLESSVPFDVTLSTNICGSLVCAYGVRLRTTPLHVFNTDFVVSLPLRHIVTRTESALTRSPIALAEMPEDSLYLNVLAPKPTHARTSLNFREVKGKFSSLYKYQTPQMVYLRCLV